MMSFAFGLRLAVGALTPVYSRLGNFFGIDCPSDFLIYIKGPYHIVGYFRRKLSKEATRLMVTHLSTKGIIFMAQT